MIRLPYQRVNYSPVSKNINYVRFLYLSSAKYVYGSSVTIMNTAWNLRPVNSPCRCVTSVLCRTESGEKKPGKNTGLQFVHIILLIYQDFLSRSDRIKAYSCATSFIRENRPDLPPWPASILVRNNNGCWSVFSVLSFATHLAGSKYCTWESCRPVVTSIAG